jgi:hypothetical protein
LAANASGVFANTFALSDSYGSQSRAVVTSINPA